ncbi:MAG: hypothetical protein IKD84_05830 [Erysipelotrichaceae bacterium]|nr:hypothetical protein [Erysipelotrichaceae bacterium]
MNRNEIFEQLRQFPYDPAQYWIITGAAMVIYGLREQTHDIDMGCSKEMADLLERDGHLHKISPDGRRSFRIGELIEVFEGWICDKTVEIEGFQVISLKGLLEMKRGLGREKDLRDIRLIEEYMKENEV